MENSKMQHKGSVLRQGHKKCTNLPPIFHRLPTTQYVYVEKFHFFTVETITNRNVNYVNTSQEFQKLYI